VVTRAINNRVPRLAQFVSIFSVNVIWVLFYLDNFSSEPSGIMLSFGQISGSIEAHVGAW
jgi:hypothetical protein